MVTCEIQSWMSAVVGKQWLMMDDVQALTFTCAVPIPGFSGLTVILLFRGWVDVHVFLCVWVRRGLWMIVGFQPLKDGHQGVH
jgi:hypothetical protein